MVREMRTNWMKKIVAGILAGAMLFTGNASSVSFAGENVVSGAAETTTKMEALGGGLVSELISETATPDLDAALGSALTATEAAAETGNVPSLRTIDGLEEELAGATEVVSESLARLNNLLYARAGQDWSFDAYYVGQDDRYHVEKDNDFSLKYQMEFHNSVDLKKESVEIRVPGALLTDREGKECWPSQIAVPQGTKEHPVADANTPFNYYRDGEDLVFFNYRPITSGSNVAFQVLYKGLTIRDIVDETEWTLPPSIQVTTQDGTVQKQQTTPLTGKTDSQAVLSQVTKRAYNILGKQYTPGLYTEKQVTSMLKVDQLPDKYAGANFSKYKFVVWEVKATTSANQPYDLTLTGEKTAGVLSKGEVAGEIVGVASASRSIAKNEAGTWTLQEHVSGETTNRREFQYYVVTAYEAAKVPAGTKLTNQAEITLHPCDGKDGDQKKEAEADWKYQDYAWVYRSDVIGVEKWIEYEKSFQRQIDQKKYDSWIAAYRAEKAQNKDVDGFPFIVKGTNNGYKLTHYVDPEAGDKRGTLIPGSYYQVTTVDDFIHLSSNNSQTSVVLDDEDYYFNNIKIVIDEKGYDFWEAQETDQLEKPVNPVAGYDDNVHVFVMYKGQTSWTEVASVPWKEGTCRFTYEVPENVLAEQPYRIKVVRNSVNYKSECRIYADAVIRHDSPKVDALLKGAGDDVELSFENFGGTLGKLFTKEKPQGEWYHDQKVENGNYSEAHIEEDTRELYGCIIMRDAAMAVTTNLTRQAESFKTMRSENDVNNHCVRLTYNLTAYDGYRVSSETLVDSLRKSGVTSPGRTEVVFYDVLPYGVRFDPSVPVTAGRITDFRKNNYQKYPSSWNSNQVQVRVDPATDVEENYRGTGRTRVRFHVSYTGADSSSLCVLEEQDENQEISQFNMWLEGWGVSFGAYYDWKDASMVSQAVNVAAFMPEATDNRPLLGTYGPNGQVMADDGTYPNVVHKEEYQVFGQDIDGDGITAEQTVLYSQVPHTDDMATSSTSGITKLVRADSDLFGSFRRSATVSLGGGYTYDVTLSTVEELKNVVIFDRLERAMADRTSQEPEFFAGQTNSWYGTFAGVITTGLKQMGIVPVVYYNADRSATLPNYVGGAQEGQSNVTNKPSDVLTLDKGWYTADAWTESGKPLSEVKAIAVDASKKEDGTDFVLESGASLNFQIRMTSPTENEALEDSNHANTHTGNTPARYAYNNPSFYSYDMNNKIPKMVIGNSVRVDQDTQQKLEVVKTFGNPQDVPDSWKNNEFRFVATKDGQPLGMRTYRLYRLVEGQWVEQETDRIHATDADGSFLLHADEKAVFFLETLKGVQVEEQESPYWEGKKETSTVTQSGALDVTTWNYVNTYRPVLYAQKKITALPGTVTQDMVKNDAFTFQVLVNGQPAANAEYWLVDQVKLDGTVPNRVDNEKRTTDAQGQFTLKTGQIAAIFTGGRVGDTYEIRELDPGDNWIPREDAVSGSISANGSQGVITNLYKWKNLYLTKKITHQDAATCKQEFTFRLTAQDGTPQAGKTWVLTENGKDTAVRGTTNAQGEFTVACAGKTVRIEGLEAGKTFLLRETNSGTDYKPVNDVITVTMPTYSGGKDVEVTNDWLLRPVSVTKTVTYPNNTTQQQLQQIQNQSFTMIIKVKGKAYGNQSYAILQGGRQVGTGKTNAQGEFTIKNGQTVTFSDVGVEGTEYSVEEKPTNGYTQVYPVNAEGNPIPAEGAIGKEGAVISFVNSWKESNMLILEKRYVAAEGDNGNGAAYVEQVKKDENLRKKEAVTLHLETLNNGVWTSWPQGDKSVTVLDTLKGTTTTVIWKSGAGFQVEPWKQIMLTDLAANTTYRVYENGSDQYKLYQASDVLNGATGFLEITQQSPANNGAFQGMVSTDPSAVIYNQVKGITEQSTIQKRMIWQGDTDYVPEGGEIPEGARLTFQVEQFDGTVWNPAEGVSYVTGTYGSADSSIGDRVETTGSDGKLVVEKQAGGYPVIHFTNASVSTRPTKVNGSYPSGSYRIVELISESDPEWGRFVEYLTTDTQENPADGFVNSNVPVGVILKKDAQGGENETFTFLLEQVIQANATITSMTDVWETSLGTNVSYETYDSATDAFVESGNTGATGEVKLKGGQYAVLQLPVGTRWTITEKQDTVFAVEKLEGTEGSTQKLAYNVILVEAREPVKPIGLEITNVSADRKVLIPGEELKKEEYEVRIVYSNGTKSEEPLTTDQFNMVQGNAPAADSVISYEEDRANDPNVILSTNPDNGNRPYFNVQFRVGADVADGAELTATYRQAVAYENVTVAQNSFDTNLRLMSARTGQREGLDANGVLTIPMVIEVEADGRTLPKIVDRIGKEESHRDDGRDSVIPGGKRDRIKRVVLPDTVTTIGADAFYRCKELTDGIMPGVTLIKGGAFYQCDLLKNVTTTGVTKLDSYAFYQCKSLETVDLPNVTTIDGFAFYQCTALTTITMPNVTSIRGQAFLGCSMLASELNLPKITEIPYRAFYKCSALKKVQIPNVTKINESAFSECSSLQSVDMRAAQNIDSYAFYQCKELTEVIMKDVRNIGSCAFMMCKKMQSTEMDLSKVESVGDQAFYKCTSLIQIDISKLAEVKREAFSGCTALKTVTMPNVTTIGEKAFYENAVLTAADMPEVTRIGNYAFFYCEAMTSATMPVVTTIGEGAFSVCKHLANVTMPKVQVISENAFNWTNMTEVWLPEVKTIEFRAFAFAGHENGKGTRFHIGNKVESIATDAFLCFDSTTKKGPCEVYINRKQGDIPAFTPTTNSGGRVLIYWNQYQ